MKTKLLCTFTNIDDHIDEIENVKLHYEIVYNKVYVLQDEDNLDKLLLTYNINQDTFSLDNFYRNTISVHRKKDSNTLYTINSLNALVRSLNGGVVDNNFIINWDDYRNTVLLVDDDSYRKIKTKLFKIIKI